jgi:hypothetical protein
VAQELLTIPEHMSSPPIFCEIRVARSSVFCVVFYGSLFFLLSLVARLSVLVGFYTISSKTKKDHQKKCTAAWYRGQFLGLTFFRLFLYEIR